MKKRERVESRPIDGQENRYYKIGYTWLWPSGLWNSLIYPGAAQWLLQDRNCRKYYSPAILAVEISSSDRFDPHDLRDQNTTTKPAIPMPENTQSSPADPPIPESFNSFLELKLVSEGFNSALKISIRPWNFEFVPDSPMDPSELKLGLVFWQAGGLTERSRFDQSLLGNTSSLNAPLYGGCRNCELPRIHQEMRTICLTMTALMYLCSLPTYRATTFQLMKVTTKMKGITLWSVRFEGIVI